MKSLEQKCDVIIEKVVWFAETSKEHVVASCRVWFWAAKEDWHVKNVNKDI